jgi:tetratricopeptide (TPR) repeat protein
VEWGDDTILYEKGRSAMGEGRIEDALTYFQQSIQKYPHFKTLELAGECLMRLGRWHDAIVALAAASTLNRGVRAPALLAEAFLQIGEYGDAESAADLALSRDSKNRKAKAVKAEAEARLLRSKATD